MMYIPLQFMQLKNGFTVLGRQSLGLKGNGHVQKCQTRFWILQNLQKSNFSL